MKSTVDLAAAYIDLATYLTIIAGLVSLLLAVVALYLSTRRTEQTSRELMDFVSQRSQQPSIEGSSLLTAPSPPTPAEEAGLASRQTYLKVIAPGTTPVPIAMKETAELLPPDAINDTPIDRLARYWSIAWGFERIYRAIFGTQIALLEKANVSPLTTVQAEEFYQKSVSSGNKTSSFDAYKGFLADSQLIAVAPDGTISITPVGRQFLLYLTSQGYSRNRVL